jgi:hypothetical protein
MSHLLMTLCHLKFLNGYYTQWCLLNLTILKKNYSTHNDVNIMTFCPMTFFQRATTKTEWHFTEWDFAKRQITKMTLWRKAFYQTRFQKMTFFQMALCQTAINQILFNKATFYPITFGQKALNRMSFHRMTSFLVTQKLQHGCHFVLTKFHP